MIVKDIFWRFNTSFTDFNMGYRLLRAGAVAFDRPVNRWVGNAIPDIWYWDSSFYPGLVDADTIVVRVAGTTAPLSLKVSDGAQEIVRDIPAQPLDTLQEFTYQLAPSPPGSPPPPSELVLLSGLSLPGAPPQVPAGGKITVGVQIHVNTAFRGQIAVSLLVNSAEAATASTGLRDFLAGSYSVPVELTVPLNTPLGTYPLRCRILDSNNNVLAQFTTDPILQVVAAPPPPPLPAVAAINSLRVTPEKVNPGEKLTATAELSVNTAFKGLMSFSLAGVTASTDIKDWLAGSYPVSLELTVPQSAPPGIYQGIWLVVDTATNKQLAHREVGVEVLPVGTPETPPAQPAPLDWLTPLLDLAVVGVMVGGVKGVNRLVRKLR